MLKHSGVWILITMRRSKLSHTSGWICPHRLPTRFCILMWSCGGTVLDCARKVDKLDDFVGRELGLGARESGRDDRMLKKILERNG